MHTIMQIKNLQCGGQTLVHGNIVSVPVNIAPTVNTLPRHMKDTDTIIIKFKKKNSTNIMNTKKCPSDGCLKSSQALIGK